MLFCTTSVNRETSLCHLMNGKKDIRKYVIKKLVRIHLQLEQDTENFMQLITSHICIHICVCVCVYVCDVYGCMYVCISYMYIWMWVYMAYTCKHNQAIIYIDNNAMVGFNCIFCHYLTLWCHEDLTQTVVHMHCNIWMNKC